MFVVRCAVRANRLAARAAAGVMVMILIVGCGAAGSAASPMAAALDEFETELADLEAEVSSGTPPAGTSDRLNRAATRLAQVASGTRSEAEANALLEQLKKIETLMENKSKPIELQTAIKNLQTNVATMKERS